MFDSLFTSKCTAFTGSNGRALTGDALAAAEAKAIADAEAAEAAAKAAEAKAKLEARENEFYANVAKQAELLAEIRDAVKKQ